MREYLLVLVSCVIVEILTWGINIGWVIGALIWLIGADFLINKLWNETQLK